jgi:hypothetical protein
MEKPQIPVIILVRVSTAKQETARQISELRQYADGKGYEVLGVCEETISGSAQQDQRHGLRQAEQLALEGKIRKVLVHEVSRIARRNSVAHRFVETLEECGVSLYGTRRVLRRYYLAAKEIRLPALCSRCLQRWRAMNPKRFASGLNQVWRWQGKEGSS